MGPKYFLGYISTRCVGYGVGLADSVQLFKQLRFSLPYTFLPVSQAKCILSPHWPDTAHQSRSTYCLSFKLQCEDIQEPADMDLA